MAKIQVDQRGGYRKKYQPWPIVEGLLAAAGEMTMADLFRGYKDAIRAAYAAEWADFKNVQAGVRRTKKPPKPPRGCVYHSFVCYMNKWTNDGLVAKALDASGQPKRAPFSYASPGQRLEQPTYYQLAGGTIPAASMPAPAPKGLEKFKTDLSAAMDEENKAASIRKLEKIIAQLDIEELDKIDISGLEEAIDDYRAVSREEKQDAFENIQSAIDELEENESE